jgi:TPR repeat protein
MEEAAFRGRVEAQRALASFYSSGLGVAADNVEAYKWMLISGANNDAKTKEAFEAVERLLTKEQRIIGQNRAKEFIPH